MIPGFDIEFWVGANGSGKTWGAMHFTLLPHLRKGGTVYTNTPINHEKAEVYTSWRDIPNMTGGILLIDEAGAVAPSRSHADLPPQLGALFQQLRKQKLRVVLTAPSYARADKIIREVCQLIVVCKGTAVDPWQRDTPTKAHGQGKKLRGPDGKPLSWDTGWPPRRLFHYRAFDAVDYEDFTVSKQAAQENGKPSGQAALKPKRKKLIWRPWHNETSASYDSSGRVVLLDHIDSGGACAVCGGQRSRPRCSCPGLDDFAPRATSTQADDRRRLARASR